MHYLKRHSLIPVTALATLLCATPVLAQEQDLPRVLILTTGGTIASRVDAHMTPLHWLRLANRINVAFDGAVLEDVIGRGPDGIVVTTFAGGRMSAGALKGVQLAVDARDLPAHKARILLMLALTKTPGNAELQRIFDTY